MLKGLRDKLKVGFGSKDATRQKYFNEPAKQAEEFSPG
jgi:hypothetical protein